MKKIKNRTAKLSGMLAISCLFLLAGACNPTGENKAETDYVNEIEAEENKVGQPDGPDDNAAPADVETNPDSVSQSQAAPN